MIVVKNLGEGITQPGMNPSSGLTSCATFNVLNSLYLSFLIWKGRRTVAPTAGLLED